MSKSSIFEADSNSNPLANRPNDFENPFHIVNELAESKNIKIKGVLRRILEYIADCNRHRDYPTRKEISEKLGISYLSLRKMLYRAFVNGLLVYYPVKEGNYKRYALWNMQDYTSEENDSYERIGPSNDSYLDDIDSLTVKVIINIIEEMLENNRKTFHNISLTSELIDKDDYKRLDWKILSQKNKGKVYEFRISRHRTCIITIYPNCKVIMSIRCSKEPFDILVDDGRKDLYAVCGEIHSVIKKETSNYLPLRTDIHDWQVTQIDGAFDLPTNEMKHKMNRNDVTNQYCSSLSFRKLGVITIKKLDKLFQIYEKNLPTKGPCLRIERRFSLKPPLPNIDTLMKAGFEDE